mgnify:CR=1 FL=1
MPAGITLPIPAQLPPELFLVIHQTLVAEKNYAGVAVVLQRQIPSEGPALPAFDAKKVGLGGKIRADDLLANIAGADHRIQQLALVCFHKRMPRPSDMRLQPIRFLPLPAPLPA